VNFRATYFTVSRHAVVFLIVLLFVLKFSIMFISGGRPEGSKCDLKFQSAHGHKHLHNKFVLLPSFHSPGAKYIHHKKDFLLHSLAVARSTFTINFFKGFNAQYLVPKV
jgi:hypothetical protein